MIIEKVTANDCQTRVSRRRNWIDKLGSMVLGGINAVYTVYMYFFLPQVGSCGVCICKGPVRFEMLYIIFRSRCIKVHSIKFINSATPKHHNQVPQIIQAVYMSWNSLQLVHFNLYSCSLVLSFPKDVHTWLKYIERHDLKVFIQQQCPLIICPCKIDCFQVF